MEQKTAGNRLGAPTRPAPPLPLADRLARAAERPQEPRVTLEAARSLANWVVGRPVVLSLLAWMLAGYLHGRFTSSPPFPC